MDKDFEKVYCEYYPVVYRYLLSLTKNESLAEEIAQETFFKALKNIHKYDPEQKMLTWLCTIAKNTYFSEIKRFAKYQQLVGSEQDDEQSIIDVLIDGEASMEILKALHSLPEPYKEVFTLRVLGSLSFKKIGEVFLKSESWARVTFFRSKAMIKECLKND